MTGEGNGTHSALCVNTYIELLRTVSFSSSQNEGGMGFFKTKLTLEIQRVIDSPGLSPGLRSGLV